MASSQKKKSKSVTPKESQEPLFKTGDQDDRYNVSATQEISEYELHAAQIGAESGDGTLQKGQTNLNKFYYQPKNPEEQKKQSTAVKKTKFKVKQVGKFFLHHKSHLNDPTLQPRKLDASENIFDIIMPWLEDL